MKKKDLPFQTTHSRSASVNGGINSQAPGLSSDGYTVAFLAGSGLRPDPVKAESLDIFLTSMKPGVTRKAGTSELTRAVNGAQGDGSASITSLALSSDGTHIAFVTQRDSYVLPIPDPVGSFSATGKQNELYMVDLTTGTLERAVVGVEGEDLNRPVLDNPTLTADGSTIAFVSQASNLIFGDANGFSDAFAATLQSPEGTAAPPASFNAAQNGFSLTTSVSPELGLSVKRAANGSLDLLVEAPGAGKLTAQAQGKIATRIGKRTRKKKVVVLARASGATRAEGTTTLVLRLASKYAQDLKAAGKLEAHVTVVFTPAAPAEALSAEANATFLATSVKKTSKGPSKTTKGKAKKG